MNNNYDPITGQPLYMNNQTNSDQMNNGQMNNGQMNNGQMNDGQMNNDQQDNEKAGILCWLSLGFWGIPQLAIFCLGGFFFEIFNFSVGHVFSVAGFLILIGYILMIVARVQYPKYKFGRVLMWIYIIHFVLIAVAVISLIIMCSIMIDSCINSCADCASMG